jgi:hypothetical protein
MNILSINDYRVKTVCLDPQYHFDVKDSDYKIRYVQKFYNIGDTSYCTRSGHNIFIEFSNMLDEYYVTKIKEFNNQSENILKYNDYKISWISCGCGWNQRLPIDLIISLIKNELYTPTNIYDFCSYTYCKNFNDINDDDDFKPFCQGMYQILGSLLWRGFKDNYEYEEVLYKFVESVFVDIDCQFTDEFKAFVKKEKHWNDLSRNAREYINRFVYGNYITVS